MIQKSKIFGIGLPKTATTSLCHAMIILGYKSKHLLLKPEIEVEQYDFVNDVPIPTRYQQYDKLFPRSKFILTLRDKHSWLKSCKKHFANSVSTNHIYYKYRMEQFGINKYNGDIFSNMYDKHNQEVKDYFKYRPNDLLVLNICNGEGWSKLCCFLNKKIPDKPFPLDNVSRYN
jgi:hypothetical protein